MPEIILQKAIPQADTTQHLYIIQLDLTKLTATRREIFDALAAENIIINVHYIPVYYLLYYSLTNEDVESVIRAALKVVSHYSK